MIRGGIHICAVVTLTIAGDPGFYSILICNTLLYNKYIIYRIIEYILEIDNMYLLTQCFWLINHLCLGTTRNNFEGKKVIHLEYEAYTSMAETEIKKICRDVRQKWPSVKHIAVHHRLGYV